MRVRIPTPLRSYTSEQSAVTAEGSTVGELLVDLDRQFPGLRFRVVDEQGMLRPHMKVFVDQDSVKDLDTRLAGVHEVTLMQALSGG
jgi:molybdopterin converting factor small subunit